MQVLLKTTKENAQTQCGICGQGFAMYWERRELAGNADLLQQVDATLKTHHENGQGPDAHPERGFVVPEWNGPVAFSGAAILGNAPNWAL